MNTYVKLTFIILLILHFVCVFLSQLPDRKFKFSYLNTIFRQNWHMFAPSPLTFSSRIIVKCSNTEWLDPTKELLEKNSQFSLIHIQKSVFLFNSISQTILDLRKEFVDQTSCQKKSIFHCEEVFKNWIKSFDAFKKAELIGSKTCGSEESEIRLGVYIEHARSYSKSKAIPNQGTEILEIN